MHGRRKGWQGGLVPWILKISAKQGCFLNFEWEKTKFTTFGPPGKILEKSPSAPPGKNPSDAHYCVCTLPLHQCRTRGYTCPKLPFFKSTVFGTARSGIERILCAFRGFSIHWTTYPGKYKSFALNLFYSNFCFWLYTKAASVIT